MSSFKRFAPLLLCLALSACGGEIEPGLRPAEQTRVKGLTLTTVTEESMPDADSYVGTVESRDRGVLTARTDGVVGRVGVREGEEVQEGKLLLEISGNQSSDRLKGAEAGAAEARGRLAAARARAELARKNFDRYHRLYEREAITPQEMDRVSAELQEAVERVSAAQGAVAGAESGRAAARTALGYDRIVAPYPAQVVRREVEEGSTVMPGTPLIVLDRRGSRIVRAEIPESLTGRISVGQGVRVEVPSAGKVLQGRIVEVQSAADPKSRSFRVKAELPPGTDLPSGLFARLIFPAAERRAILVPAAAIVERGQLTGVYVVRDGVLHYRLVKTGRETGGRVEILSGLEGGETVVVGGVEKARSGARVEG